MTFFKKKDEENNYQAINWNKVDDELDKMTWEKLVEQFWTDTRIPISNDKDDWRKLSDAEKTMVGRVFGGLTLLDTLQSQDGIAVLKTDVLTQHEEAVLNNIGFMECLTEESDLLVKGKGWTSVKDIKENDLVLQYDSDKRKNLFDPVTEVSSHVPEKLYRIYNEAKGIDMKMSKGHRVLVRDLNEDKDVVFTAEEFFSIPREELTRYAFISEVEYTSMGVENDKSDMQKLQLMGIRGLVINGVLKMSDTDKGLKLVYNGNSVAEYEEIRAMMESLNWKTRSKTVNGYTVSTYVKNHADVIFLKAPIYELFEIENLSRMEILDLIDGLSMPVEFTNPTNVFRDGKQNVRRFISKDPKELKFFETLLGLFNSEYTYKGKDTIVVNTPYKYGDSYVLAAGLNYDIIENTKKEKVYGVRVPSTYIVTRTNNGRVIITGNSMHAKSYSSIFSTLNTPSEIDEIFEWTNTNPRIQYKAKVINDIYENGTPLQKKAASVMLESFLFYSGFYAPLYYLGVNKMPNVAEVIRLIIRDESVHGTYIGAKFRIAYNKLSEEEQAEIKNWVYTKVYDLYTNEELYTQMLYDELGWTNDVLTFVRYNANKALQNLGFDSLFSDTAEDVNPIVMNGLSTGTANHDFFSQVGNGYRVAPIESMSTEDYDY